VGRLTQQAVIEADGAARRMSHDPKVRLADEIYAQQPTMLASIRALPRMGVDMALPEVALHGGPHAPRGLLRDRPRPSARWETSTSPERAARAGAALRRAKDHRL
jgi:hypothetical protein